MADVNRRTVHANVDLTKNELTMVNQRYFREDVSFTESFHMRVTLATNMSSPQEVDLTGGDNVTFAGESLMVTTDREIDVGVDASNNLVNVSDNGMFMVVGSYTHLYVQNNSTTYTANVEIVGTD